MRTVVLVLAAAILFSGIAEANENWTSYSYTGYVEHLQGEVRLDFAEHSFGTIRPRNNGGWHLKWHQNTIVNGVVLTGPYAGAELSGHQSWNEVENVKSGGEIFHYTDVIVVTAQGDVPNFKMKVTGTVVVNADGEVVFQ